MCWHVLADNIYIICADAESAAAKQSHRRSADVFCAKWLYWTIVLNASQNNGRFAFHPSQLPPIFCSCFHNALENNDHWIVLVNYGSVQNVYANWQCYLIFPLNLHMNEWMNEWDFEERKSPHIVLNPWYWYIMVWWWWFWLRWPRDMSIAECVHCSVVTLYIVYTVYCSLFMNQTHNSSAFDSSTQCSENATEQSCR